MEIPDIGLREMTQEMCDEIDEILVKFYKKGLLPEFLTGVVATNAIGLVMSSHEKRDQNFETLIKFMKNIFEKEKIKHPLV